jgi:peroxisomal 2,4-dienoyl-CoA reductase
MYKLVLQMIKITGRRVTKMLMFLRLLCVTHAILILNIITRTKTKKNLLYMNYNVGSGICYEIGHQLLLHGCNGLVICGRRENVLMEAAGRLNNVGGGDGTNGNRCRYKVCDVRDPSQCELAVQFCMDTFGQMDILINGAAGNFLAEASALSPNGFKTVLEIDTMGTFNMCHASFPHLKKISSSGEGGAVIINISATLQYGATWFQIHASAAKSAVDSLTRSLALEWGLHNIRVNGIAPGPIANTPGTTKLAPPLQGSNERKNSNLKKLISQIPLGRMGESFDIAMAAVFLCSSAGSYISGDVLVVDGGQWLFKPPILPREMVSDFSRKMEDRTSRKQPLSSKL